MGMGMRGTIINVSELLRRYYAGGGWRVASDGRMFHTATSSFNTANNPSSFVTSSIYSVCCFSLPVVVKLMCLQLQCFPTSDVDSSILARNSMTR